MYEEEIQEQVQIAMSVDHPLNNETQHSLPPGSGSRSPLFALLLKPCQLRIALTLFDWQVQGVSCFPQSLPVPGFELAIHGRQLGEQTSRAKRDGWDLTPVVVMMILLV